MVPENETDPDPDPDADHTHTPPPREYQPNDYDPDDELTQAETAILAAARRHPDTPNGLAERTDYHAAYVRDRCRALTDRGHLVRVCESPCVYGHWAWAAWMDFCDADVTDALIDYMLHHHNPDPDIAIALANARTRT